MEVLVSFAIGICLRRAEGVGVTNALLAPWKWWSKRGDQGKWGKRREGVGWGLCLGGIGRCVGLSSGDHAPPSHRLLLAEYPVVHLGEYCNYIKLFGKRTRRVTRSVT